MKKLSLLKKMFVIVTTPLQDNTVIKIHHLLKIKKMPNARNPKSFVEKILCIKLSNWLEDKGQYVDKYKVRQYIESKIGLEYLPKLYGIYKLEDEIKFESLPNSFVIKLNNGSGCNIIVKNKQTINQEKIKKEVNKWMKSNYYNFTREKQYKNVEQMIICEEYLQDESGELKDYKFFCFSGKVKFVQVDSGRFSNHIQNFYDINWNKVNMTYVCEENSYRDNKPTRYNEMVQLAEKLAEDIPFVRVDLYYVDNKIYFGELTFTPNNGFTEIRPKEKDLEVASWIDLSKYDI